MDAYTWSVKAPDGTLHRLPLDQVKSVALDTSSYTSAALTRILFGERYGNRPEFIHLPPDLDAMLAKCDAALLIGVLDFALKKYVPQGGTMFIYAVTILLLLWRPQGLFTRQGGRR